MSAEPIHHLRHEHVFLGTHHARNERRARIVVGLTLAMMVGEIAAGIAWGSMALLADGWHMATHAGALSITAAAYAFARRHARDPRYVFGTGKVGDLAGFTSAVVLAGIACLIGYESLQRLLEPRAIQFDHSIAVALLGLAVNVVSALLLHVGAHEHGGEAHHHADHNLRAAHLHVVADALTSVAAIVALMAGKLLGWSWTDPLCGIAGSLVILRWSAGLARDTAAVLVDRETDPQLAPRIRACIEDAPRTHVTDLHVWRVGPGHYAAIVCIESAEPATPAHYKARLAPIEALAHVTVEVHGPSTASPGHVSSAGARLPDEKGSGQRRSPA